MAAFDIDFPVDFMSELLDTDFEEIAKAALEETAPILENSMKQSCRRVIEHPGESELVDSIKSGKPKRTKTDAWIVNVSPRVDDEDDYVTKQAWELHCRVSTHLTPLQSSVYAMCTLDGVSQDSAAHITGVTRLRVRNALERAEEKVRSELDHYGRGTEFSRYNAFLRKVADSLTDMNKLKKMIIFAL